MDDKKLKALSVAEYNLIAHKDPNGYYDRATRENLHWIIEKLRTNFKNLSSLESRLYLKFRSASFSALEEKDRKVKREVAKYRLSTRVKRTIKLSSLATAVVLLMGFFVYQFILNEQARSQVDLVYFSGLKKMGLVTKEGFEQIEKNLDVTTSELEKTKKEYVELTQTIERMIHNNKISDNLKYILRQIYDNPNTRYTKSKKQTTVTFDGKEIAKYSTNPKLWYLLGIIDSGVMRVYYNDREILEIETIFGRTGEETPLGEYEIKNRLYKPTWYKKEIIGGKKKVRIIPFGDPDHDIGYWWMGMKKLGDPVPGSYGLHGVNVNKANEFVKKNFDWRNGSAGCPNVQNWYLHFLAKVVPLGARINIVQKDKWARSEDRTLPQTAKRTVSKTSADPQTSQVPQVSQTSQIN